MLGSSTTKTTFNNKKPILRPRSTQDATVHNGDEPSWSVSGAGLSEPVYLDLLRIQKQEISGYMQLYEDRERELQLAELKRRRNDSPVVGGRSRSSKTTWQGRRALLSRYSTVSRRGMAERTRVRLGTRRGAGRCNRGPILLSPNATRQHLPHAANGPKPRRSDPSCPVLPRGSLACSRSGRREGQHGRREEWGTGRARM